MMSFSILYLYDPRQYDERGQTIRRAKADNTTGEHALFKALPTMA